MRSVIAVLLLVVPAAALAQDGDWGAPPPPPPPPADTGAAPTEGAPSDFPPPPPPAPAAEGSPSAPPPEPPAAEAPAPALAPPPPDLPDLAGAPPAPEAPPEVRTVPVDPYRHSPATLHNDVGSPGNLRRASSFSGPAGLLHVLSAQPGPRGTLRFGLHGSYFRSSGFPVLEEPTTQGAGALTIAYGPLEWLEVYGAYSLASTRHQALEGTTLGPPLLWQTLGDMWLGGKAGDRVAPGLWLGGDLRVVGFTGIEDQLPGAVGVQPSALLTWDARESNPDLPVRMHLNLGILWDNTKDLVSGELTPAETFALNVSRYTRFAVGAGIESPLPFLTPFVEFGYQLPLGAPATLTQPDGTEVSPASAGPMALSVGARITAVEDVSFLLATDIGLQQHVVPGVIPTPPYNVVLGVTYTFDPLGKREQVILEKPAVVEAAGKVAGQVLDAATRAPVPGVVLAMSSPAKPGLPPVATDASGGRFVSYDLPPGPVEIVATKDGYQPVALPLTVEAGKETPAEILLVRAEQPSKLRVSVRGPRGPLDARVAVEGPQTAEIALVGGEGEAELAPGSYRLRVTAAGHLSREASAQIAAGQAASVNFELARKPKSTVLIIRKDRILTKRTIQFRTGESEILVESYPILDEVAAAIIDNNYRRVRVEGHTDNVGGKAKNQRLSQERAAAVRDYLVNQAGIDASRIDFAGFGDTRPIAPNLTARGKAMNRRVEFAIED